MGKVIGIDLGTTNSCVAVVEHGEARILPAKTGQNTTPSVVATTDNGKRLVGHLAKRQAITNPVSTVHGAKRLIGRRWDHSDCQRALSHMAYECKEGPRNDVRIVMGEREYAVAEIASIILHEMRAVAEKAIGEEVTGAVITVPAYFNDHQRQATKDAGRIAGLDVLRIINEPTAAALAFGYGRGEHCKVAVYDLGGGTFDISIMEIGNGIFEVLATSGDTFLGGEDFDDAIIDWLLECFRKQHDIDLSDDSMAIQRLRDAAERAKVELSSATEVDVNLPFIYSRPENGESLHLEAKLTREKLDQLVKDLLDRTFTVCAATMSRLPFDCSEIDKVLLVGGMTRMPAVQHSVEKFFGVAPSKGVHPDEVVAKGAAIQAYLLEKGDSETLLLDVTPHHLGIMIAGGQFDIIIERDTTLPTSQKKVFTTVRNEQNRVRIVVMQGGALIAAENDLLGEFVLDDLRKAPAGEVRVEVTFEINADGIVGVSACDLETGHEQSIVITASSGLSESEIKDMMSENEETALTTVASNALETARIELERLMREVERLTPEVKDMVDRNQFSFDVMVKIEQGMLDAKQLVRSEKVSDLTDGKHALDRTLAFMHKVLSS